MNRKVFDLSIIYDVNHFNKFDTSILCNRIIESDFLISDDNCTHRLIGLHYIRGGLYAPIITVICTRNEMAYAKKIAFENGKKIYRHSKISAILFKKYPVGAEINPEDFSYVVNFYANFYEKQDNNKNYNNLH